MKRGHRRGVISCLMQQQAESHKLHIVEPQRAASTTVDYINIASLQRVTCTMWKTQYIFCLLCPRPSAVHERCASSVVPACTTNGPIPSSSSRLTFRSVPVGTPFNPTILIIVLALWHSIYLCIWWSLPLFFPPRTPCGLTVQSNSRGGSHSFC